MRLNLPVHLLPSFVVSMFFAAAMAAAQTTSTHLSLTAAQAASSTPSAGLVNDWLRHQDSAFDSLDLGGQFRPRYVSQTYFAVPGGGGTAVDFRANTPHSENDFLLLRTRFHLGYSPTDWLQVYGEGQNSSSTGDRRNPSTSSFKAALATSSPATTSTISSRSSVDPTTRIGLTSRRCLAFDLSVSFHEPSSHTSSI